MALAGTASSCSTTLQSLGVVSVCLLRAVWAWHPAGGAARLHLYDPLRCDVDSVLALRRSNESHAARTPTRHCAMRARFMLARWVAIAFKGTPRTPEIQLSSEHLGAMLVSAACLYVLHSHYASINDGKLRKPHIAPHLDSAAAHESREKLLPVS